MVTTTPANHTTNTITTLKTQSNAIPNAVQSKLPNILPRTDETNTTPIVQTETTKGLVGGVTTWFPASSRIQVASNQLKPPQLGPVHSPRPQFVEFLGDKKYLIVPKHNIVSVSPSTGSTANLALQANKERRQSTTPDFRGFTREEINCSIGTAVTAPGGSYEE